MTDRSHANCVPRVSYEAARASGDEWALRCGRAESEARALREQLEEMTASAQRYYTALKKIEELADGEIRT